LARQSYEAALKSHDQHKAEIKQIEADISQLEKKRLDFEKELQEETMSQGVSVEEREKQMRDYQRLKEESVKRTTKVKEQFDTLNREQKLDQDGLDNEMRKKNDASNRIKQKQSELDEQKLKLDKLVEYIE
jgi:structural maintenance of chromosome 1